MIYYSSTKLPKEYKSKTSNWVKPQKVILVAEQKSSFQALAKHGAVVPAHSVAYNQNSCKNINNLWQCDIPCRVSASTAWLVTSDHQDENVSQ